MQGIVTAAGGRVLLAGLGDAEVLLDWVFLANLVCVALVHTYTHTHTHPYHSKLGPRL